MILLIGLVSSLIKMSPYVESNAELVKYVMIFRDEARNHNKLITERDPIVIFGSTPTKDEPRRAGYCDWYRIPRLIVIDRRLWELMPVSRRELLIFHELGHCLLLRRHELNCRVDSKNEGDCPYPESIMYPVLTVYDYEINREYYLKELFK